MRLLYVHENGSCISGKIKKLHVVYDRVISQRNPFVTESQDPEYLPVSETSQINTLICTLPN